MQIRAVIATSVAFLLASAASQAASVFDGKWKADLDKNQKSDTTEIRQLIDGTYECRSCDPPYKIKADGSDQAITGNPMYDTINARVVDSHTVMITVKKAGKLFAETTISVSADGSRETVHQVVSGMGAETFTVEKVYSRAEAGAPGSHAISGAWTEVKTTASENVDVTTFKMIGDTLKRDDSQGSSYLAKLDGTPAPYRGDPRWDQVSVKMINSNTIDETYTQKGELRMRARWSIDPDGVTMHAHFEDPKGHTFDQTGHKVQ
jgi:hypothetical protein